MTTDPHPRNPCQPLGPTELTNLQHARAAAQAWLDACEVDTVRARQKLEHFELERQNARAALEDAAEKCEAGLRLAHNPAAGVGSVG